MRRTAIVVVALLAGARTAATADAPEWTWPEKPQNMKVLPPEVAGKRLGAVMRGFTRALGVRCVYCHVGEEGKPLSTYDFASDKNPNKERAREMLRMLGEINGHLKKIEPSQTTRVNMWCHTCHRGRPRPTTLGEELRDAYKAGGEKKMTETYHQLRDKFYGRGALDFGAPGFLEVGSDLLESGDVAGAIAVYRLGSEENPKSGSLWEGLAEAYLKQGDREVAEVYFRKALEVDPENDDAVAKLRDLRTATVPAHP